VGLFLCPQIFLLEAYQTYICRLMDATLFIDFDSTFNQKEALEVLLEISIPNEDDRAPVLQKLEELTNLGMEGKIDYMQSLTQRMALLAATKDHISLLVERLKQTVTPSIVKHQEFLVNNKDQVHIISNGFSDFIRPVIEDFGLRTDHVHANSFVYNDQGEITSLDKNNPLSKGGGKPIVINSLNLTGKIIMIGDGFNDYQAKKGGAADQFILFTENVRRESVVPLADAIAENFDEVLEIIT